MIALATFENWGCEARKNFSCQDFVKKSSNGLARLNLDNVQIEVDRVIF